MTGGFFTAIEKPSTGAWIIRILGSAFVVLHSVLIITFPSFHDMKAIIGLLLYLASFSLFWWAIAINRPRPLSIAFSADTPMRLVSGGPYKFIRHPFYVSYLLAWFAGAIATANWILIATCFVMGVIYVKAALFEEAKFQQSDLSHSYQTYRGETGMFLPRLAVFLKNDSR